MLWIGWRSLEGKSARFCPQQNQKKKGTKKKGKGRRYLGTSASLLMMADADRVHSVQTVFGELEPARQKLRCVSVLPIDFRASSVASFKGQLNA